MKKSVISLIWLRLRFYFQAKVSSEGKTALLGVLRLILIINSVYFLILINERLGKVPRFHEATVGSGELVEVITRANKGGAGVKVELPDGVYFLKGNFGDRLRGLEVYVGQVVNFYYYSAPSMFLFKTYVLMDIDVGDGLIFGNWDSIRESLIANSKARKFRTPVLIFLLIIALFEITLRR